MAESQSRRDQPPDPESIEELKRRRRQRWSAFLTPLITLSALVMAIGLVMFLIRSCSERLPDMGFFPGGGAPPQGLVATIRG